MTAGTDRIFELQRMPPIGIGLLRVATASAFHRRKKAVLPNWQVRLVLTRIDPKRLAAYRAVCGFVADARLPIVYPQVLASRLHWHLMTRRGFPFSLSQLEHVANTFEQDRPLDAGESL